MAGFRIGLTMGSNPCDYDSLLNDRITFGGNTECNHPTYVSNTQPILLDGVEIGVLYERYPHDWREDLTHSFMVPVNEVIDSDHYIEDESSYMAFANLTDFLHYLKFI